MKYTASLKIKQQEVPAPVLMYIKKKTGLSLWEIKKRIKERKDLVIVSCIELQGVVLVNELRKYLLSVDIDVELYYNNILEDPQFFINCEEVYREEEQEDMYDIDCDPVYRRLDEDLLIDPHAKKKIRKAKAPF